MNIKKQKYKIITVLIIVSIILVSLLLITKRDKEGANSLVESFEELQNSTSELEDGVDGLEEEIDKLSESISELEETLDAMTFEPFNGVDLTDKEISNIKLGNMIRTSDGGYGLYPYTYTENVYESFKNIVDSYDIKESSMALDQNIEYNPLTGEVYDNNLVKSYGAYVEDEETGFITRSIIVNSWTRGQTGGNVSDLTVTLKSLDWETSNNMLGDFLSNILYSSEIVDILKKTNTNENIVLRYDGLEDITTGEVGEIKELDDVTGNIGVMNISIKKENYDGCRITLATSHNTTYLKHNKTITNLSGYENVDDILEKVYTLPNNSKKYTFEYSDSILGNDINKFASSIKGTEGINPVVKLNFRASKDNNGVIHYEQMNFENRLDTVNGALSFVTSANYDKDHISIEFDIENNVGTFTDEEKVINNELLVLFASYLDENTEISTPDYFFGAQESGQSTSTITGQDGKVYMVMYGYMGDAYALNITNNSLDFIDRKGTFETYK